MRAEGIGDPADDISVMETLEGFRWALLGTASLRLPVLAASAVVSLLLLTSGAFYFRRMERSFADIV